VSVPTSKDRRNRRRYPIVLPLFYRILSGRTGMGQVTDISSSGLYFRSDGVFAAGELIELSIAWPVRSGSNEPLDLFLRGIVVRSDGLGAAVSITKYDFRLANQ
jgi:hypothetical protein